MKIKLIRNNEMVISRKEYIELLDKSIKLHRTSMFRVNDCRIPNCAILNGKCPLLNKCMNPKKE